MHSTTAKIKIDRINAFMPTHTMQITVQLPTQQVLEACTYEALRRKWPIAGRSDQYLQLQQPFNLLSFCWPVRLEVICQPSAAGTSVTINVSNLGFGPIQNNCAKNAAQEFATLLLATAPITSAQPMPPPTTPYAVPQPMPAAQQAAVPRPTTHSIFLAYRRSDSLTMVNRIRARLAEHFGEFAIHSDMDAVPIGMDVRNYLGVGVTQSKVLLAIIAPQWLTSIDPRSNRRIVDPDDSVRIEIEAALKRGMPTVPILVDDARLPASGELPPSLGSLAAYNGMVVRQDPDFAADMDAVIRVLEQIVMTR